MDENRINEEVLDEVTGGAVTGAKKHVKIVNCQKCVNVRSTPADNGDANKIGYAYLGDRYVMYGWSGNWAKVQYGSKVAYIFKDFVQIV